MIVIFFLQDRLNGLVPSLLRILRHLVHHDVGLRLKLAHEDSTYYMLLRCMCMFETTVLKFTFCRNFDDTIFYIFMAQYIFITECRSKIPVFLIILQNDVLSYLAFIHVIFVNTHTGW